MKPYLAIIKDSFRAALATKVLYLMLLLITGLLLVVAPLGIKEELTFRLTPRDIFDSATFSKSLVEKFRKRHPPPQRTRPARTAPKLLLNLKKRLNLKKIKTSPTSRKRLNKSYGHNCQKIFRATCGSFLDVTESLPPVHKTMIKLLSGFDKLRIQSAT